MRLIGADRWGGRDPIGKGAKPGGCDSDFSFTTKTLKQNIKRKKEIRT